MLAPGAPGDPVQFIDSRDLADFVRLCTERRIGGVYNLCNQPRSVTMGSLLETSRKISKADTRFTWADAQFLEQQKLTESGELPIWSPPTGETAGAALISPARAVAQGLRFRSLETTVTDTLAWHRQRPAAQQEKLRAGLSAERETELLALLKSRKG
jgi:2'-hydroxyisoflavone reductase